MNTYTEIGVATLALTVVLAAFRFLDYRLARNGNGKRAVIVEYPHRVEALAEKMHNVEVHLSRMVDDIAVAKAGTETLVKQHAPTDGREQWKISPRLEAVMDRIDQREEKMIVVDEKILELLLEIRGGLPSA